MPSDREIEDVAVASFGAARPDGDWEYEKRMLSEGNFSAVPHYRRLAEAALSAAATARPDQRQELFDCYVASGADTDGCGPEHLNPGDALRAVQELRKDYDESADWEGIARELYEALMEAKNCVPDRFWYARDLGRRTFDALTAYERASLGEGEGGRDG